MISLKKFFKRARRVDPNRFPDISAFYWFYVGGNRRFGAESFPMFRERETWETCLRVYQRVVAEQREREGGVNDQVLQATR